MLPKLKLVTFSCLKNSKNRVGILLENKSVIDLTSVSPKPVYYDMLKFIDGGKETINETKSILKNPPSNAIVDEKSVVLKAPIPLPRFINLQDLKCICQVINFIFVPNFLASRMFF